MQGEVGVVHGVGDREARFERADADVERDVYDQMADADVFIQMHQVCKGCRELRPVVERVHVKQEEDSAGARVHGRQLSPFCLLKRRLHAAQQFHDDILPVRLDEDVAAADADLDDGEMALSFVSFEVFAGFVLEPALVVQSRVAVRVDDVLHLLQVAAAHLGLAPGQQQQDEEQEQQACDEVLRVGVEERPDAPALVEALVVEGRIVENAVRPDEADLLVEDGEQLWLHLVGDADGDVLRGGDDAVCDEIREISLPDVVLRGLLPQEGDVCLTVADGTQALLCRGVVMDLVRLVALQ